MAENENAAVEAPDAVSDDAADSKIKDQPAGNADNLADDTPSANKEAAKYRVKLRETEAKLAAAEERVMALMKRAAEAHVKDKLSVPADLWDVGKANIADLLDDNGDLDTDALDDLVGDILSARPGLGPVRWGDVGVSGQRGSDDSSSPSWADALKRR
ncbi:hypothetical protein [Streptomyces cacaoi]|uniref:hypothetical protein n=1 Tax=Streptomyces cacaoi TaxID=1898 RepID=UPI00261C99B6|nr:hypothetical protein [Streptomyces cacaoi]